MTTQTDPNNPVPPSQGAGYQPPDKNTMALWRHYEDIAMHFNDLLMRWRLHAMGGMAALVTIGGFSIADAPTPDVRYRGMLLLSFTFLCAWIGVAIFDLKYYRQLLIGAVAEILRLEDRTGNKINLSNSIEVYAKAGRESAPIWFYIMGSIPLLALIGWALLNLTVLSDPPQPPLTDIIPN